jgi:hypothetical protein
MSFFWIYELPDGSFCKIYLQLEGEYDILFLKLGSAEKAGKLPAFLLRGRCSKVRDDDAGKGDH